MKTVTLNVASWDETSRRLLRAFAGKPQGAFISFETPELLFKVLSGKRWGILRAMQGAGAITLREAARRVGRDVKAVHSDVHALLDTGILEKTAEVRPPVRRCRNLAGLKLLTGFNGCA